MQHHVGHTKCGYSICHLPPRPTTGPASRRSHPKLLSHQSLASLSRTSERYISVGISSITADRTKQHEPPSGTANSCPTRPRAPSDTCISLPLTYQQQLGSPSADAKLNTTFLPRYLTHYYLQGSKNFSTYVGTVIVMQ